MILLTLTLRNFKQYRELDLEFPEGLIGIVGKNGSGKSTLFEAVLCGLYGEIPVTREYIRSADAADREPVSVILEFEIEGKRYRVVREYRGKSLAAHSSLFDFNDKQVASGQKEVSAAVENLIGMGCDAFTRSIFSGQKDLGAISMATGGERRLLIRRMIGMDRIDDIQKLLREDRNVLRESIKGQATLLLSDDDIHDREQRIEELGETQKTRISQIEKDDELFKKISYTYEKIKVQFEKQNSLFREYTAVKESLGKITATREGTDSQIKENADRLNILMKEKKEMVSLEDSVKEWSGLQKIKQAQDDAKAVFLQKKAIEKQRVTLDEEIHLIMDKIRSAKENVSGIGDVEIRIKEKEHESKVYEKKLADTERDLGVLRSDLGGVRMRIKEREESIRKITAAGRDSSCPTCLRPLAESFDATLEKLGEELSSYQKGELHRITGVIKEKDIILKELKDSIRVCEKDRGKLQVVKAGLEEVRRQISTLDRDLAGKIKTKENIEKEISLLDKISYDEALHDEILRRLKELEPVYLKYHKSEALVQQIPDLQKRIGELRKRRDDLEKEEKELAIKLKGIGYSEEEYNRIKVSREECEVQRESAASALNVLREESQKILYNISTLKNELKVDSGNRKKVEKNRKDMETLNKLDWFFDDFRNVVLDRVKPAIAGYAGELFNRITAGRYEAITVDGDFSFFILDEGHLYPIQRFSGGEVDCANLCLRIAISRAIRDLAGGGAIGFLGFDEIFGSQDLDRRREIMNALLYLKEMYRQIFIISHVEDIKEEFPLVLHVSRTPTGSQVRWLNAGGQ